MVVAALGIAVLGLVVAAVMFLVSPVPTVGARAPFRRYSRRTATLRTMLVGLCLLFTVVLALVLD